MANLTAEKEVVEQDGELIACKIAASKKIYKGAILKFSAAGYIDSATAEAGATFAGIAYETVDNSAGGAGAKDVRVIKKGLFLLSGAGFAQSDVGNKCYASDDQTISNTQGANEVEVGTVHKYVSATQVWVRI